MYVDNQNKCEWTKQPIKSQICNKQTKPKCLFLKDDSKAYSHRKVEIKRTEPTHIWLLIYDKGTKSTGERMAFDSGSTGNPYKKKRIFDPYLAIHKNQL